MSVFKVALNNAGQGLLDTSGATSIQRTIYVAGPKGIYRKLVDGTQFTDSNYYKRFAYPQVPLDQAFIQVITDDGSVYSDVAANNTYPKVYNLTVANGSTYAANVADILGDTGSFATFVQVSNQAGSAVKVRLNGSASAIIDLGASETQVFNTGELSISKLEFANTVSGGTTATIQILVSVMTTLAS